MRFARARWWLFTLTMPVVIGAAFVRCGQTYGDASLDGGGDDALSAGDAAAGGDDAASLWRGPALGFFSTADGGAAPACPSDHPQRTELFADLSAAAASCEECACAAPTIACAGTFQIFPSSGCQPGTSCSNANGSLGAACSQGVSGCGSYAALGIGAVDHIPGQLSCKPTGPEAGVRAPVAWGSSVALCEGSAAPSATAEGPPSCIWHAGESISCPAEYPTHHVLYASADDARGCTCDCSGGMAYCVDVKPYVYRSATCGGNDAVAIPTDGKCVLLPADHDAASVAFIPSSVEYILDASCTASGTPVGTASAANPMTVCCAP